MATREPNPKSVECPICLSPLTRPKLLSCNHTFCESCLLTLHKAQRKGNYITCPLCRKTTRLSKRSVSKLGTNLVVQSLIDELGGKAHFCTTCKIMTPKTPAVSYCEDCDEYMCESCQQKHADWGRFTGHKEFSMEDVTTGKAAIKTKRKCSEHKTEVEEFFCRNCKKYVCFRCRILDHSEHTVIKDKEHEREMREKITALMARVDIEKGRLTKHANFIEEQQQQAKLVTQGTVERIEAARDEAIERIITRIKENSDTLVRKCRQHEQAIIQRQEVMKCEDELQGACVESAGELVSNGMKARLEGNALVAHDTLCNELEKLLDGCEVRYSKVRHLTLCAKGYHFKRGDVGLVPDLGSLEQSDGWVLGKNIELPTKDSMNCIAATHDGRIAVGCKDGGIEIFSADGQLQQTVLTDVGIRRVEFLSNGRYVVRDGQNTIKLYTPECVKLDVRFETLSDDEGGSGGLNVDSDDQIYVSYRKPKKIQVFARTGGRALREISCDGFEPLQIFAMKSRKMLVVKSHTNAVTVVDELGSIRHKVITDGDVYVFPALCHNDSIMIACIKRKEGRVSIEEYTSELKHVTTLISDHKIQKTEREWYYLQEFLSGELAFCTPDRLYTFHKSVTLDNV